MLSRLPVAASTRFVLAISCMIGSLVKDLDYAFRPRNWRSAEAGWPPEILELACLRARSVTRERGICVTL
jgi:hypothetical protein